ncbi:MAG: DUF4905 domain-containing protein [Melioribacteraceae bacterium]|nr:DUF4905 domain-containing protein [Melioribacteraceae bacterium]
MKFKKLFSFSDRNQIWRLLISDSDKLIIETRNTHKKEVFFNCVDLLKGKKIFKDLQLNEKFWIGIEAVYKDIIYFHEFAKPNMPEHKKIIALDLNEQKVLWKNDDLIFLSVIDDKVYCYRKKFEGRNIFSLNYLTGEETEDMGDNPNLMNEIVQNAIGRDDYKDYKYPEIVNDNFEFEELFNEEFGGFASINKVEQISFEGHLFFNYHVKNNNNLLDNKFAVYNIEKKKKVISDTLNRNLNSFSPDSFFLYKRFLILLKNRAEIICYKLS